MYTTIPNASEFACKELMPFHAHKKRTKQTMAWKPDELVIKGIIHTSPSFSIPVSSLIDYMIQSSLRFKLSATLSYFHRLRTQNDQQQEHSTESCF